VNELEFLTILYIISLIGLVGSVVFLVRPRKKYKEQYNAWLKTRYGEDFKISDRMNIVKDTFTSKEEFIVKERHFIYIKMVIFFVFLIITGILCSFVC